jgi:hypothetical protein
LELKGTAESESTKKLNAVVALTSSKGDGVISFSSYAELGAALRRESTSIPF